MQEYQPANLFDKDSERIFFSSQHCREHCFSLENLDKPSPSRVSATKATLEAHRAAIPDKYREWLPIMSDEAALRLPDHQPWDHKMYLIEGQTPPCGPLHA